MPTYVEEEVVPVRFSDDGTGKGTEEGVEPVAQTAGFAVCGSSLKRAT